MQTQLRKASRRNAARAFQLYAQGVSLRRRLTYPEIRAMRAMLDWQLTRPMMAASHDTKTTPVRVQHADGEVRGEWVERPGIQTRDETVVLYVHGGAFVAGSLLSHRGLVSELSQRTRRSVFSVDYRLAPEHRFPAASDDVLRAYSWLLSTGVPASRIVVAGDSAGGHLALGLTPRAVRAGLPAPAGVVAFSPVIDVSMGLSSARERELDTVKLAGAGRAAIRRYHPGVPHHHPELLLTGDDLSVMPPVLIQASEHEMLAADAEHYVAALRAAGGQVELRMWPRKFHVFQVAHRISRAASEALDDVAVFADRVSGAPSTAA